MFSNSLNERQVSVQRPGVRISEIGNQDFARQALISIYQTDIRHFIKKNNQEILIPKY